VSCEPEDLTLGMRTEVVFDHVEDVWLPLFKPCAEQPAEPAELPADEIPAGTHWRHVRPMVRQSKFEDKAAITGIGASAIGRRLMRPPLSLTIEARERAVADAGLTMADIDGLSTYPGGAGGVHGITEGGVAALEPALGIQPTWYSGGTDTFGPGGSVIAALVAVAAGAARHVLCFRTVWESTCTELMKAGRIPAPAAGGRAANWMYPFGATSATHTLAQMAQRHFRTYGGSRETLG